MAHENFYVYGRDAGDGHPALVVLNRSLLPRTVEIEIPAQWSLAPDAQFQDVLGATVQKRGRILQVHVGPRASALLLDANKTGDCLNPTGTP